MPNWDIHKKQAQAQRDTAAGHSAVTQTPPMIDCGRLSLTQRPDPDQGARTVSSLHTQHGGDHYKTKAIQPVTYCMANNIGFMEGSAIKYLTRWKDKGGVLDLKKAKHFIEMLIEEQERGNT